MSLTIKPLFAPARIDLEIFPTPIVWKNTDQGFIFPDGADSSHRTVNDDVRATAQLVLAVAHAQKTPLGFIHAGPIAILAETVIAIITKPCSVNKLTFSFHNDDTQTVNAKKLTLRNHIMKINQYVAGEHLYLVETACTIFSQKSEPMPTDEKLMIASFKEMMQLDSINSAYHTFKGTYFLRSFPKGSLTQKKVARVDEQALSFLEKLQPKLSFFGEARNTSFSTLAGVLDTDTLRYCGLVRCMNLKNFESARDATILVCLRQNPPLLGKKHYPQKDKYCFEAQGLSIFSDVNFSKNITLTPEGVVLMRKFLPPSSVANPAVWVSHSEFRSLLVQAAEAGVSLHYLVERIIASNYHLMLSPETTTLAYKKTMEIFEQRRGEYPIF